MYGKDVLFLMVYVVDPHPLPPDLSPYSGDIWTFKYTKFRQARTFGERVKYAQNVSTDGVFDEVLVDTLQTSETTVAAEMVDNDMAMTATDPRGNNAVWCSWGPAPNTAWVIGRNGTVLTAQFWYEFNELNATLASL